MLVFSLMDKAPCQFYKSNRMKQISIIDIATISDINYTAIVQYIIENIKMSLDILTSNGHQYHGSILT